MQQDFKQAAIVRPEHLKHFRVFRRRNVETHRREIETHEKIRIFTQYKACGAGYYRNVVNSKRC